MPFGLLELNLSLPKLAIVLMRVAGLFLAAPLFSSRMLSVRIRIALALTLALMVAPLVDASSTRTLSVAQGIMAAPAELAIGAAMGLALAITLGLAELAGFLVGQQAGLALGQVVDPTQNAQASIVGQVYSIVATLLFLWAGGHRALVIALLDTYKAIPPLTFAPGDSAVALLVESLSTSATVGFRLAAPVIFVLLLVLISLSVLSRTMPQLNILSVGFTFKVLLALGATAIALAASGEVIVSAIGDTIVDIREVFGLSPTPTGWNSTWP